MMNTIKFKQFLKNNRLEVEELPQPLLEKVILFERLYEVLSDIEEPDRVDLLEQIEVLDLELLEDIEQEYEDQLEHNDRLEELSTTPVIAKALKKEPVKPVNTDEQLLKRLVSAGRTTNIGRSELEKLGFKSKLQRDLVVGSFALRRSGFWHVTYDIIPLK